MTSSSRASHRLVSVIALSLLAAPLPLGAAPVRKGKARVTAPTPTRAGTGIIALPLALVVPAAQRSCAARTSSGLGYTVLRPAAGAKPGATDVVLVNYIGYLAATGVVFDQGMRSALSVNEVIPGFAEGLQTIAKTGITRLCIPAKIGYGAQASGPIPANADLVFQVELVDYKTAADIESMRAAPTLETPAP